jgi:IS5 family transposase
MKILRGGIMTFGVYDLDKITEKHPLSKIKKVISFDSLVYRIKDCSSELGRNGYGLDVALKSLFTQFYYDLSDREMEEKVRYDIAIRWVCGFTLDDDTPDHSYFCRARKMVEPNRIGKIFRVINEKAEQLGHIGKIFNFCDSTKIISKQATWDERDKALAEGAEKLDNNNVQKYGVDKDARFGCKGKDDYWYGYKRHQNVDMRQGLITKVAVTSANITDWHGFANICPDSGMVFADKAYCLHEAQAVMKQRGCHSGAILRENMKDKNADKDCWLTKVRMPFEGVFSKMNKRARYRGLAKIQLQAFMDAIVFNVTRLTAINSVPLFQEA